MENPLVSYREWFAAQYVVWADMIASAAMDTFDALYSRASREVLSFGNTSMELVQPDGQGDGVLDEYQRGKHTARLLNYIDQTLAKENHGITVLVASLLFEVTIIHMPLVMSEAEYRAELDMVRTRYHQALVDGDEEQIEGDEDYLETLEEDHEARLFMNETWQEFSQTRFNLDTIADFQ